MRAQVFAETAAMPEGSRTHGAMEGAPAGMGPLVLLEHTLAGKCPWAQRTPERPLSSVHAHVRSQRVPPSEGCSAERANVPLAAFSWKQTHPSSQHSSKTCSYKPHPTKSLPLEHHRSNK